MRADHAFALAEAGLWLLAFTGAAVGVRRVRGGSTSGSRAAVTIPSQVGKLADTLFVDSIERAAQRIISGDPFRLTHTPPLEAPVQGANGLSVAAAPPQPKPALFLRGVLGEPGQLRAILLGIPGRPGGAIVQAGDTAGGLTIKRITRDSVSVQGLDTLWRLTVRAEWQP